MDESKLRKLIKKGESGSLEFKRSLRLKEEIGEAVSAFSNSSSGTIIIGIDDSGRITTKDYIAMNHISERTARTDLVEMVNMGVLQKVGKTQAAYYIIRQLSWSRKTGEI